MTASMLLMGEKSRRDVGGVFLFLVITLSLLFIMSPLPSKASVLDCKKIVSLDDKQVKVILESYERGYKDDLGYTLAAIALKESSAGKYRINPKSGDFGIYGINYKTVARLSKVNYYESIPLLQEIITDDDKGAEYALKTLKWNIKHFKGDWRKAIMMYNKGSNWEHGTKYAAEVALNVRILRTCLPIQEKDYE